MNSILTFVLARLAEPSTWVGAGVLATSIGSAIKGDPSGLIQALGGLLGMLMPEGLGKAAPPVPAKS